MLKYIHGNPQAEIDIQDKYFDMNLELVDHKKLDFFK